MSLKLVNKSLEAPCEIRFGKQSDRSYIMDSWLKAHRSSPTHRHVDKEIYYHHQPEVIDQLINQSFVIVACSPEDDEQILGYCVCQPSSSGVCVIHWLAVKQLYRKLGIGSALYHEARKKCNASSDIPAVLTHISGDYKWLKDKWDLAYSPFLLAMECRNNDADASRLN